MVFLIIFAFILALLIYFLLAPISLIIDTNKGLLKVNLFYIGNVRPAIVNNDIVLKIKIFGIPINVNLTEKLTATKSAKTQKNTRRKKEVKPASMNKFSFKKMFNIMRSFRLREFKFHLDTGDYALNGFLFPIFFWMSRWSGRDFNINFINQNELVLHVQNSLGRILFAYLKPLRK